MVTVLGWLIFALGDHPYFIAAAISGFLMLGPILGAGLIDASRAMEGSAAPTFESSLRGLDRNRAALERLALDLLAFAAVWLAVGCYLISVIAVPLILDQQASAGEAVRGSLRALSRHPLAGAIWALLIVVAVAIGFATALIGFVVLYPVLGHASWHAYRALRQ